jgi:hypothetical protein
MRDQNKNDSSSDLNESIQSAFEATRESLLAIDLKRLEEFLGKGAQSGHSLEEIEQQWSKHLPRSLSARYSYIWSVKLPWWCFLRTPISTSRFLMMRRRAKADFMGDPAKLEELDGLLARAEFSVQLSAAWRNYLRQKIDNRSISRWAALTTVRSFGCKVSKEGEISPNPIGPTGYIFGITAIVILVLVIGLFAFTAISEFFRPCLRVCVLIGSIQIIVWATYIAAVVHSLSQGRRRAVRVLQSLLTEF